MLHTFETRLTVDADLDALLAAQAAHWSWGLRKAWTLLYRQRLTKPQAYTVLVKLDFTSAQVGSLLISAEMKHAGLVELKKYELKQLELAIVKRERAVFDKNKEVRWLPQTKQLRIRLTDRLAHTRMDARGVPHAGTQQKFMPMRMQCRFITLDNVDFTSHKGAARAALVDAFGKRPVTMRVLSRLQPDGSPDRRDGAQPEATSLSGRLELLAKISPPDMKRPHQVCWRGL